MDMTCKEKEDNTCLLAKHEPRYPTKKDKQRNQLYGVFEISRSHCTNSQSLGRPLGAAMLR
jgi:hypothetical protein